MQVETYPDFDVSSSTSTSATKGDGPHEQRTPHARGEDLGRPRGAQRRRRARPALHRPAPRARGHQPAGLRRPARGRAQGPPSRPDDRHRGPQRPDDRGHRSEHAADRTRQPGHRPGLPHADRGAAQERRRVRHPAAPDGRRRPGHRARDRPAARPDPAGHDDRLRRLAHLDARRVRRAGVRHRHQRGRARAGDPDAAADQAQDDGDQRRRRAAGRRHRQGPDPRDHRPDRHRRRPGLRRRVPRRGRSGRCPWRAA